MNRFLVDSICKLWQFYVYFFRHAAFLFWVKIKLTILKIIRKRRLKIVSHKIRSLNICDSSYSLLFFLSSTKVARASMMCSDESSWKSLQCSDACSWTKRLKLRLEWAKSARASPTILWGKKTTKIQILHRKGFLFIPFQIEA